MAVATGLAIASIAVSAAGTGMSFAQAAKQRRLQEEAEKKASARRLGKRSIGSDFGRGL